MDLSFIIPCCNSGNYLSEAIESVENALEGRNYTYEVIVIDDGSEDAETIRLLSTLPARGYIVIYRENGGPAAARNTGLKRATGDHIIFLDSDNVLKPHFIDVATRVQQLSGADIVHCQSDFFGETTEPRFITGPFDIHKLLIENYIDICCLIKKEVFDRVGRFDEEPLIRGFEDWEFFIRSYSRGCTFEYVEEPLYDYRVRADSVSQQHSAEHIDSVKYHIYRKHIDVLLGSLDWYRSQYRVYMRDKDRPLRSFFKFIYNKYL